MNVVVAVAGGRYVAFNLNRMRSLFILLLTIWIPIAVSSQNNSENQIVRFPKHYFSVNPINCIFFQQLGITYEFKPNRLGYEITAGYVYPNHKSYSNYFIAGPTNNGSLGDYTGFFVVPQLNIYLNKPKNNKRANLIYFSPKIVYKYLYIDSTKTTAWKNQGDGYYLYRKMIDQVNIYGGFIDFGYKFVYHHFFIDLNFGVGILWVDHDMIISESHSTSNKPYYYNPPIHDHTNENHFTINFTLNVGGAF